MIPAADSAPSARWLRAFDVMSFDCYGTLVDWERGIVAALRGSLGESVDGLDDEWLLRRYAEHETRAEAGVFRDYRTVLQEVFAALCADLGVAVPAGRAATLADTLPDWPPFPDTVGSLQRLSRHFRLAILSNVDDDLFAGTARNLRTSFCPVVTAQQVGSYKPARANFEALLRAARVEPARLLHVAQSLFHDIAPARELGIATIWVDRRGADGPGGATPRAEASPDWRVSDLRSLAEAAESS